MALQCNPDELGFYIGPNRLSLLILKTHLWNFTKSFRTWNRHWLWNLKEKQWAFMKKLSKNDVGWLFCIRQEVHNCTFKMGTGNILIGTIAPLLGWNWHSKTVILTCKHVHVGLKLPSPQFLITLKCVYFSVQTSIWLCLWRCS